MDVPHDPDRDLIDRLHALGRLSPSDPAGARHLAAMHAAGSESGGPQAVGTLTSGWRPASMGRRLKLVAVFVAGFVLGGTGLAYAGALPGPVQNGAANVLSRVGLNVPRSTVGCPDGKDYKNHGQYVEEVKAAGGDVEAAAASQCGKPAHAGAPDGKGATDGTGPGEDKDKGKDNGNSEGQGQGKGKGQGSQKHAGDPCKGRPPWAGDKTLTDEQKDALEAQRDAACPDDQDEDEDEAEAEDKDDDDGQGDDTDDPDEGPDAPQAPGDPPVTTSTVPAPLPDTPTSVAPAPDAATTTMVATPSSLP